MSKNKSEIDRLFEQGVSEVTRQPQRPLSEAQLAAAAAASKSGAGILLLSHAKEILLCVVSLLVGIGGTLLVTHFTGSRNTVPTETAAAIPTDTANTARAVEDTVAYTGKTTVNTVETCHGASPQSDSHAVPAKPASNVSSPKSHVSSPVIVKKTVVQRDTVVINETVTLKDTVYVP